VRAHLAGYLLAFVPDAVYHYRFRGDLEGIRRQAYSYNYYRALLRRRYGGAEPLLTVRPWALLFQRGFRLAQWRAKLTLRRRQPGLHARAMLARAEGQLWGQVRGALAFRVAPPRPELHRRAFAAPDSPPAVPGDMALTPPA